MYHKKIAFCSLNKIAKPFSLGLMNKALDNLSTTHRERETVDVRTKAAN